MTLAEAPMDCHGYGIWLLIFIVIACLIFWARHHPTTVASIRASLEKLTATHAELAATHADLVQTHIEVVNKTPDPLPTAAIPPPWSKP